MSETKKRPTQQSLQQHVIKAGLMGGLLNGCLIVVILGIALGAGLWLDALAGSEKRIYTFGLLLASVPITFVVIFFFGRWFSSRMKPPEVETSPEHKDFLEDADSGND